MGAVSQLKVGVDVPWVTSWSGEALIGVRPCPSVDGGLAIVQEERPGHGRPQYSMNHMRRQRESVRARLCPMCGQPTPEDDRWSQVARPSSAGVLRARGYGAMLPRDLPDERVVLNAGSVTPLHRACAERALRYCPHLKAYPDHELRPFPKLWGVMPLLVEAEPEAQARHVLQMHAPTPPRPVMVVSFLQLCGVTEEVDPHWRDALQ